MTLHLCRSCYVRRMSERSSFVLHPVLPLLPASSNPAGWRAGGRADEYNVLTAHLSRRTTTTAVAIAITARTTTTTTILRLSVPRGSPISIDVSCFSPRAYFFLVFGGKARVFVEWKIF